VHEQTAERCFAVLSYAKILPVKKQIIPILFVTLLIDMIGIGMLIPITPILFTDPTSPHFILQGYSTQMQFLIAGLVTALYGLVQFLAAPLLGQLSDVYGRKKLLMLGVGVLALSQLCFGLGIEFGSLFLLFVSRIVGGLAAANFSIAQAAIADVTEPKDRAKNFGLIGAAFGIAFIIGPILGGWIAGATGSASSPFWIAGVLGVLNLLFVALFLPETHKVAQVVQHRFHPLQGIKNIYAAFADKDARPVFTTSFLYMCGFAAMTSFFGVLLVNRYGLTEAEVGTFYSVIGGWVVFTQLVVLRFFANHYSERAILRVSLLFVAVAVVVQPFSGSLLVLYALTPLFSIPHGLSIANITSLVSKSAGAGKQGAALGINGSLIAFAQGVIPILVGLVTGWIGITAPFLAGGVFIIGAWLVLFLPKEKKAKVHIGL